MSNHLIEEKTEDAFANLLTTCSGDSVDGDNLLSGGTLAGLYLYKGLGRQDVKTPNVSIWVDTSEAYLQETGNSGNWVCNLNAEVITHVNDETRSQHSDFVGLVRDILISTNIVTLFNDAGVSGYSVDRVQITEASREVDEDLARTVTSAEVYCYAQ